MTNARTIASCLFLAAACASAPAAAQPPSADPVDAAITDRARDLYNDGRKAFAKGDYPAAHAAFLAAWGIKKHWQIAANLADTELRLKRFRDAAEHADYYLRNAPADRHATAAALLGKATPLVAARTVTVSEPGAEISLDGHHVEIGDSAVYVEPGHHVLEATRGAKHARVEFDAPAGSAGPVELKLAEDAPGPVTGPAVPPKIPVEPPHKSVPLIVAGLSVAAVGVGFGIGGVVASSSAGSTVHKLSTKLGAQGPNACSVRANAGDCSSLTSAFKREGSFRNVAIAGFAVGGAALVGTIVYLALPSKSEAAPAAALGAGPGRLTLSGRF